MTPEDLATKYNCAYDGIAFGRLWQFTYNAGLDVNPTFTVKIGSDEEVFTKRLDEVKASIK